MIVSVINCSVFLKKKKKCFIFGIQFIFISWDLLLWGGGCENLFWITPPSLSTVINWSLPYYVTFCINVKNQVIQVHSNITNKCIYSKVNGKKNADSGHVMPCLKVLFTQYASTLTTCTENDASNVNYRSFENN